MSVRTVTNPPARPRKTQPVVVLVMLLGLLSLPTPAALASATGQWRIPGPATKLYIGQAARLTAQIPAIWMVPPDDDAVDYGGPSGFVVSHPLAAVDLDAACAQVVDGDARAVVTRTTWEGKPACTITKPADAALGGPPSESIVLPHPHPFRSYGTAYGFAALTTDPAHFAGIVASLSFAPDRVTPQAYTASVLDLLEARSLFRDKLDWPEMRQFAMEQATTWTGAHIALDGAMDNLKVVGDYHSSLLSPEEMTNLFNSPTGFGLFLLGQRVLQVNAGGPAATAGIEAGDRIIAVDGRKTVGPLPPADLSVIAPQGAMVTITVAPGQGGQAHEVTLRRSTYSTYLAPVGRRLDGNLGYLQLFWMVGRTRVDDYARTGQNLIAATERQPTCGWIIDLRNDYGGNTAPMLQAVGSLLTDGRIFGFRYAGGAEEWAMFRDGGFYRDGQPFWPSVPARPSHGPDLSQIPVAMLVGPNTASAAELTAISFIGRPGTRLFGSATAGDTSGNVGYELFDGYSLALAEVYELDRTGKLHMGPITPDEVILSKSSEFDTPNDATLSAAETWLHQQPTCQQLHPAVTPTR